MSDNFTLVDHRCVLAYPESQRISMDMIPSLQTAEEGRPAYGKLHLPVSREVPVKAEARAIYLLSFGESASIRTIGPEEALQRINAIHDYISEFPEYTYLRFLGSWRRVDADSRLKELFGRCRLYSLVQSSQPNLEETNSLIEGTL